MPQAKSELVDKLLVVFKRRGFEGATLTQLAEVTSLGKASLYHHFPGGKAQMVEVLLEHCIDELNQRAFAYLDGSEQPERKLAAFVDGFADYAEQGTSQCLIAVLGQGSAGEIHNSRITECFGTWETRLAQVLEAAGFKRKRAARDAQYLLSQLYGSLLLAVLQNDPRIFTRVTKRLKRSWA